LEFKLEPGISVQDDRSGWNVKRLLEFWKVKGLGNDDIASTTHENLTLALDQFLMLGAKISRTIDKAFDA
jgi:hypothetical protein